MKNLLALVAALGLGWSMLGCAEKKAPTPPAAAPGAPEAKPDAAAPAEPAPTEEKK